jgi:SAM-dependent methyltransferase
MERAFDPKNWLVNVLTEQALRRAVTTYAKGKLLDIGCGIKPYKNMVAPFVTDHVGVDHVQTLHGMHAIDLIGTAYEIPAADDSFDTALSTAVLEHLEDTPAALRECFRVLKPGAHAIYTVPFIWHIHEEPRDFYRFSRYGLEYQFAKAGFDVIEIKALSGFWVTFTQLFVYYLWRFNRGPLKYIPVIPVIGMIVQAIGFVFDKIDRAEKWTWMYLVVARKPLEATRP